MRDKSRYYRLAREEDKHDLNFCKEMEFNIYECFHQKYLQTESSDEKQAVAETFQKEYPESKYDITKNAIENEVYTIDTVKELFEKKINILTSLCNQIVERKNQQE